MGNFIEKIQQLADQIANNHQLSTEFIYNKIGDILVDMNIATFVKDYKPKYNAELFDMITNVLESQNVPSQKN